jgi:hypothetical protein
METSSGSNSDPTEKEDFCCSAKNKARRVNKAIRRIFVKGLAEAGKNGRKNFCIPRPAQMFLEQISFKTMSRSKNRKQFRAPTQMIPNLQISAHHPR